MVTQQQAQVFYPDRDGKPMADNTKQFRWIVVIEQNLELLFGNDPDVFVAGDLLWYPVEGNNVLSTAPDTMVVFGRPKTDRGSYQQWREADIPPQVVFEMLSPGNTRREMDRKLLFYNNYGVEEYYLYDLETKAIDGWCRSADSWLERIDSMAG
jgi:Uma2 family endonuclease